MAQEIRTQNGIVIYADERESSSKVVSTLKRKCDLRVKVLEVADYLLSDKVAAERKTSGDFLQSIVDGRIFRQIKLMKESFESPVLIIEGNGFFDTKRKIHPNAIRGTVASLAVEFAMPMLWTQSQSETAELLYAIAKREQLHLQERITIRGKKKARSSNEEQIFLVSGLPKISGKTAKKLLEHFKTPQNIFNASEEDLTRVRGIGKAMARKIRHLLEKNYEKSILE